MSKKEMSFRHLTRKSFDSIRGLKPGTIIYIHPGADYYDGHPYLDQFCRECRHRGLVIKFTDDGRKFR